MRSLLLVVAATAAAGAAAAAQQAKLPLKHTPQPTTPAISQADLMTRLYIYADDSLMGREVGTPYHLKATAYIEREVRRLGLEPGGDSGTYFQNIPVFNETVSNAPALSVEGRSFSGLTDFIPRDNAVFGAPVRPLDGVQTVYGGTFSPSGDTSMMISPAAALGKFVVISVPNGPDGKPAWSGNRQPLTIRYLLSAGIGVVGLDAVPDSERPSLLEPTLTFKNGDGDPPQLPAFMYMSNAMAQAIMGAPVAGLSRGAAGKTLHGAIKWNLAPAPGRNVVAILPGSDPKLKGEYVAIGAHNDHIGFNHEPVDHDSLRAFNTVVRPHGADDPEREASPEEQTRIRGILDSLRKVNTPRKDSIDNGADDDGSGTVAALEIAEAFAAAPTKPKRSLVFVWHAGEEKGLWGSEYFTDHPTVPRDSIVAQLNMDMIGRGGPQDEKNGGPGYLQLIGSKRLSTELGDIVEAVGKTEPSPFHFDYSYDANGHPQQYYCRSDHYEYARYGIPITFFSTGGHRDYHQVTDEPQYIDYAQLARVANLVHDVAARVANLDHRVVVDHQKPDPHGQCRQ
ncbi:MAG TPA: M20/M25/M40 family metallo-hydrolase [Gemmatimonadaceae bacterium]|nr:M20/M25/M40 family metallo-hydrolase [Gemmatimonadaceae bacterium]